MKTPFKKMKLIAVTSIIVVNLSVSVFANMTLTYDGINHEYTGSPINLIIDGDSMTTLPMKPVIIDNRTMVPAREVFEKLGAVVDYKPATQEVYIGYNKNLIVLTIGSGAINYNGVSHAMDVPPMIINNKTMIPVRAVSEILGMKVNWDSASNTVSIDSGTVKPTPLPSPTPVPTPAPTPDPNDPILPTNVVPAVDTSSDTITAQTNPVVNITSILLPAASNEDSIVIKASGPISSITKTRLEDNRLILDIGNSLSQGPALQSTDANPSFTKVRSAQNATDPAPITRVVTELKPGVKYSVTLSPDRTQLRISFSSNKLSDVNYTSDGTSDSIKITGVTAPTVNSKVSTDGKTLKLEIPSSTFASLINQDVTGVFGTHMKISQENSNTLEADISLKKMPAVTVLKSGATTTIKLVPVDSKALIYDSSSKSLIINKATTGISMADISLNEDHIFDYDLKININGNFKNILGGNTVTIGDDSLQSYTIKNNSSGNTDIDVTLSKWGTFQVSENPSTIVLAFKNPKEIYPKIVVLDPGHGGVDSGAVGNGLLEKTLNIQVAMKVRPLLQAAGFKVYMTRVDDTLRDLPTIGEFATAMGDLLLSIHTNSAGDNPLPAGTETLWYPHDDDDTAGISSYDAAVIMQNALIASLGSTDRGPKKSPLIIFKHSTIPSILGEMGFITNVDESALLATDDYQNKVAQGFCNGVINIFKVYTPAR